MREKTTKLLERKIDRSQPCLEIKGGGRRLTDEVLHRAGDVQALTGKGVDQGDAAVLP